MAIEPPSFPLPPGLTSIYYGTGYSLLCLSLMGNPGEGGGPWTRTHDARVSYVAPA